jgi:hypothetical protein
MQHKGIIFFPFFPFSYNYDFEFPSFFSPLLALQFSLNRNVGPM